MSPDLAYFISFLIFSLCAYKYGHKKLKDFLSTKIQGISDNLLKATEEKEQAQLALSAVKTEYQRFEQTIHEREEELEQRLKTLKEQHEQQLAELLKERENYHRMLLQYDERVHLHHLKEELTALVMHDLKTRITEDNLAQKNAQAHSLNLLRSTLS